MTHLFSRGREGPLSSSSKHQPTFEEQVIHLSNDSLLDFLKREGYNAELQKETDQIAILLTVEGTEYILFLRILPSGPVLQILSFIPCTLKADTLNQMARLLHLLNKELDAPGFGMDETSGVVFYRITIPAVTQKVDPELFKTYMNSIKVVCNTFSPVIINVSRGTMSFDAVLAKAQEARR